MLYTGLVFGVIAGNIAAHAVGLDPLRVYVVSVLLLAPTIAGARLMHVALNWRYYRHHRGQIWDHSRGGQAQYGGLFIALPLSVPLLAAADLPFSAFWDIGGVTILVGMIFTRIGCYLNGCCAGRTSRRWGVYLPNSRGEWKQRVPTQFMEAGWALFVLASGVLLWPSLPFRGALFLYIVAGYALGRLFMESMREHRPGINGFTVHHALSLCMIMVSVAVFTFRWPK
jgi:prolipoprotein diacylglyceryltransferase